MKFRLEPNTISKKKYNRLYNFTCNASIIVEKWKHVNEKLATVDTDGFKEIQGILCYKITT
jgi:hypothetical protein